MPHEYLFDFAQSKLKTETSLFTQKKKRIANYLNRSSNIE